MRITMRRSLAAALAGALALSTIALAPAQAASDTTTFSSVRKHRHHYGNAAAFGAVVGMFGIIAGLAAADRYGDNYYYYGYDDGPYYAPYGYYGGSYGYAPGFRGHSGHSGHSGHGHHHR
jgi:hypothetical protein